MEEVKEMSAMEKARAAGRAKREQEQKKKKSSAKIQRVAGLLFIVAAIACGYALTSIYSAKLGLMCMLGLLIGITLQRGRFCFAAAARDPMLTGGTLLSKAVIIAIAVASAGFLAIQYGAVTKGLPVPGYIKPVGLHTAIGAFVFGIGMVLAGGCASGTLMRIGEGFTQQLLALVFFVCGVMLAKYQFDFWKELSIADAPKVHLPTALGWFPAIVIQFGLLLSLYFLVEKLGIWRMKKIKNSTSK